MKILLLSMPDSFEHMPAAGVRMPNGALFILVDDGIATGSTVRAAVRALFAQAPARLVLAVPIVAASTYSELRREVDEVVALMMPKRFYGVGEWYEDFSQTSDAEVTNLLERARSWTVC
jgi:putative phosphoribosyl transferase